MAQKLHVSSFSSPSDRYDVTATSDVTMRINEKIAWTYRMIQLGPVGQHERHLCAGASGSSFTRTSVAEEWLRLAVCAAGDIETCPDPSLD